MKKSNYHIEVNALVEDGVDTNGQPSYKTIKVWVDCYMIQDSLNQKPRPAHAFKKLWALGERSGGKSYTEDIRESIWTLQNELDMNKNDINKNNTLKEVIDIDIYDLIMSVKLKTTLRKNNLKYLHQIKKLSKSEFLELDHTGKHIGPKLFSELCGVLKNIGVEWPTGGKSE